MSDTNDQGTGGTGSTTGTDNTGQPQQQQQQAPTRPEWLPEAHWDAEAGGIKEDFGAHYAERDNFFKTETERKAALAARKPEDIKLAVEALPEELRTAAQKAGLKIAIDEKDPRVPLVRQIAIEEGLPQTVIDKFVAMDAQLKLAQHTQEMERVADEDKKLGANGKTRKETVARWADGLKQKGDINADEYEEIRLTATSAAGVRLLEKLMAKATGTVPSNQPPAPPPPPAPKTLAERMYPNLPSTRTGT